jgi:PadR family transcriptional regulator, regulatory protein PadR
MQLRRSPQTVLVFTEFLREPEEWKYGYDISRSTGLKSGTLYPILMRLADRSLLDAAWETVEAGRPPRHMYKLTADGLRYARAQLTVEGAQLRSAQPAFSGGKA